jgi:DNA-directed RNA polymerase specialized sigma24 family protein
MKDATLDDDRLRRGLSRGERWAYQALFTAYGRMVATTIALHARHLSSSELADEVQDVFVAVLRRPIDVRTSIVGYLRRAALNHCASRARHWEHVRRLDARLRALGDPHSDGACSPEEGRRIDVARVRAFLAAHPEEQIVYEMLYVDEIGRHTIMKRTGWTERDVRRRIKRLHDALDRYLREPQKRPTFRGLGSVSSKRTFEAIAMTAFAA